MRRMDNGKVWAAARRALAVSGHRHGSCVNETAGAMMHDADSCPQSGSWSFPRNVSCPLVPDWTATSVADDEDDESPSAAGYTVYALPFRKDGLLPADGSAKIRGCTGIAEPGAYISTFIHTLPKETVYVLGPAVQ